MSTLEHAVMLAVRAHQGQKDKGGAPYLLHPLRVMLQMRSDEERIAAVLHDVVEDSEWTLDALRAEGFSEEIVEAVEAVTRRREESYEAFIDRAARHPIGRRVKLADLVDNVDLSRLPAPTERDRERVAKYRRAMARLESVGDG